MKVVVKPVLSRHGEIILYDVWIDGEWQGSRRTPAQINQWVRAKGWSAVDVV